MSKRNSLLDDFERTVQAVPLKSRPKLKVFVLQLSAGESSRYFDRMNLLIEKGKEHQDELAYTALSEHVCDENGKLLLDYDQAKEFVEKVSAADLRKLMRAIKDLNNIDDARALEEAQKN